MTDTKSPRIVRLADPDAAIAEVRRLGLRIVTFSGFSGGGYEDQAGVERLLSGMLDVLDPRSTVVCSGATEAGIGAVYPLAMARGFTTIGIVSSMAEKEHARFSDAVDIIVIIEDDTWGGCIDNTDTLSPTSRVIVEASDEIISIGGGEIARDEYRAAEKRGKLVRYEEADMNHAAALDKARSKGIAAPSDFKGEVHKHVAQR